MEECLIFLAKAQLTWEQIEVNFNENDHFHAKLEAKFFKLFQASRPLSYWQTRLFNGLISRATFLRVAALSLGTPILISFLIN